MDDIAKTGSNLSKGETLTRELTGAQIIWDVLVQQGVEVVFGYPGGAIMPAYDAMIDFPLRHVLTRHEQGAAHMAEGYARASGKVGVALATSGPGATNLVTGIADAMMDSIPLVAITGQVPAHLIGSDAFQEVDITGVCLPITKHTIQATRASEIMPALKEAFYVASSGRPGPVLVDITKNAQIEAIEYRYDDAPVRLPGYRPDNHAKTPQIEAAAKLIKQAERPIIFCGHGVIKSNATAELIELAEKTSIPVALTLLGLGGFPASHAQHLGMMGMHGESWVNQAIQDSDLIIAVGMRFDDRVTGNLATYAQGAKKIHIELDPAEINKIVRADVPLVGDARATLQNLLPLVEAPKIEAWNSRLSKLRKESTAIAMQVEKDDGRLLAAQVIADLWKLTEGNAIVVTDVGQHQMWEAQYYKHDAPRTLLTSGGAGTMGFALPAAIGARFAKPDAEIWVIAGDGGFQMTAAELQTCAQEGIKINIAVINNGFLGMVRQWQQFFFSRRYVATPITSPDFVKLAEAHGLVGLRAEKRSDVARVVKQAQASKQTAVVEFRVEAEDSVYPMVPAGAALDKMIRRPSGEEES